MKRLIQAYTILIVMLCGMILTTTWVHKELKEEHALLQEEIRVLKLRPECTQDSTSF